MQNNYSDAVQLTDDLLNDLIELSEDLLSISQDDWNYLLSPEVSDDIPKRDRLQIEQVLQQIPSTMANSLRVITPLNVIKAIPTKLKSHSDGDIYANILSDTGNAIFINDAEWLSSYNSKKTIQAVITELNFSEDFDIEATDIKVLMDLWKNMIHSQTPEIGNFNFKDIEFSYDFSSHWVTAGREGGYKIDSVFLDLKNLKNAKMTFTGSTQEIERAQKIYERDKNRNPIVVEDRKKKLDSAIDSRKRLEDSAIANARLKVDNNIENIKKLKIERDAHFGKYKDYSNKYIKNYKLILGLIDKLESKGLSRVEINSALFNWSDFAISPDDLTILTNIVESKGSAHTNSLGRISFFEVGYQGVLKNNPLKLFLEQQDTNING